MSFSELTLEKLIGEINGLRHKMNGLYEDYGRTAQDLQDRINVLGYTLNGHLKEMRDQIVNTPQRLLSLETKYVQGEVTEDEYRSQRDEFKNLLQRNLHSVEEVRSMLTVLSQLEVKPLNPTPPVRPDQLKTKTTLSTIPEERGRETGLREISLTPSPFAGTPWPTGITQQSPPQIPQFQNPPSTPKPDPIQEAPGNPESEPPTFSPSPLQGTAASAVTPTLDQVSGLAPGLSSTALQPEETSPISQQEDVDPLLVKIVPEDENGSTQPDPSISDVVETPDIGSEASITSDVSQDTSTLVVPQQFYHVSCPKCGTDVEKPAKIWELKGGKSKKNVLIGLFQCQDCMVKFREALTKEII